MRGSTRIGLSTGVDKQGRAMSSKDWRENKKELEKIDIDFKPKQNIEILYAFYLLPHVYVCVCMCVSVHRPISSPPSLPESVSLQSQTKTDLLGTSADRIL